MSTRVRIAIVILCLNYMSLVAAIQESGLIVGSAGVFFGTFIMFWLWVLVLVALTVLWFMITSP